MFIKTRNKRGMRAGELVNWTWLLARERIHQAVKEIVAMTVIR